MEAFRSPLLHQSATTAAVSLLVCCWCLAATSSVVLVDSFAPVAIAMHPVGGNGNTRRVLLFAESSSSPQYQKQEGILRRSECVGKGSYLLYIDSADGSSNASGYEPGHVLALEIQSPSAVAVAGDCSDDKEKEQDAASEQPGSLASRMTTMSEKAQKDSQANDGWVRGPYTVSRGYGSSITDTDSDSEANNNEANNNGGFQVLVKEVGFKSHVFATCPEGTPIRFGGKFKVPITEGILAAAGAAASDAGEGDCLNRGATTRVVMVATGVGVGPCVGASEQLLATLRDMDMDDARLASSIDAIDLVASFRTREEIAMALDLDALQQQQQESNHPKFRWNSVVTGETGRLSANGPEVLADRYLRPAATSAAGGCSAIRNTHYHIIGNGQLVNEWSAGLKQAGVPLSRVTTEAYFNHAAESDPAAIDTICEAILRLDDNNRDGESKEIMEPPAAEPMATTNAAAST